MSDGKSTKFEGITGTLGLSPLESPTVVGTKQGKIQIGIPKERSFQEHRILLDPEAVRTIVANGNRVLIESKDGEDASFSDREYSEAGAEITRDIKEVFQCEMILKVAPPTNDEIELMTMNQTLISPLHLPAIEKDYLLKLMKKRVTALAFEYIKDQAGGFPLVRSMSEIAGKTAVLLAAEYLSNTSKGNGVLLGGIAGVPPAEVVILGAGVVGTAACQAALGLGATVKVFDNNVYKLMRLQNALHQKIFTSIISPRILANQLESADVAIGAIHSKKGRTPIIVTEEMVEHMKSGSVIVDVSIDQGGCFETSELTSHKRPTFKKHDVIHYGVPNIPSRVARTASQAFSHIITPMVLKMNEVGGVRNLLYENSGIRHGTYLYQGGLTNEFLGEKFNIKCANLELLFATNI
jgi:alanine dehydrogenase